MGFPLNSYMVLKELAGHPSSEECQRIKTEFNLYCFIIHDPITHKDFHKHLSNIFDRLDYLTGDKLLFLSLVDPPQRKYQSSQNRLAFERITHRWGYYPTPLYSKDESITAHYLAQGLEIPVHSLPCLVITRSMGSRFILWGKTSTTLVSKQLEELGYIASRNPRIKKIRQPDLEKLLRQDFCSTHPDFELSAVNLTDNVSKVISDILGFIVLQNPVHGDVINYTKPIVKSQIETRIQSLKSLRSEIKELYCVIKNPDEETNNEFQEEILEKVGNYEKMSAQYWMLTSQLVKNSISSEKEETYSSLLEYESYGFLRTAMVILNALEQEGFNYFESTEIIQDFSPGLICYSKVFEKEINFSVVHWIREKLGIKLPKYFNKYQPNISARYSPQIPNSRPVEFNQKYKNSWLPPGIGQSELVAKSMAVRSLPSGFDKNTWNILLKNWKLIREKRNQAAHTEIISKQDFIFVKLAFDHLFSEGIFYKLYNLKSNYRDKN